MIGIICNYYIRNYGSALQSTALQYKLGKMGYENVIINYEESLSFSAKVQIFLRIRIKKLFSLKLLKQKIVEKKHEDAFYDEVIKTRNKVFKNYIANTYVFSRQYSSLDDLTKDMSNYSCVLVGSDQLWCPSDIIIGYHTLEWVPLNIHKVSYATSFGVGNVNHWFGNKIRKFTSLFSHLSIREESGKAIIKKYSNINALVVLDPTLLLTSDEWDALYNLSEQSGSKNYIFCYFLSNNKEHKRLALDLKKKTNCQIVSIPFAESYDPDASKFGDISVYDVSPKEFVNYIKNSKYVLTDSFHATVFSILYHKKFVVFDRYSKKDKDSRNTRIENILNKFDLSKRRYSNNIDKSIEKIIDENIDYKQVDSILSSLRLESEHFLVNSLDIERNK